VKHCAVLYVNPEVNDAFHIPYLRCLGFIVHETDDWPADDIIPDYHVVIIRLSASDAAPMLAARLRAKPHFGRRVLIALVDPETPAADRRSAEEGGFDDVLNDRCECRLLTARILRSLRARPELRCALPRPSNPRTAA
jgi:hypothetical protein